MPPVAFIGIISLLLTLTPALSLAQTIQADFGVNYALTSSPTSYSFVSGGNPPLLTISGFNSSAVTFAVSPINEATLNSSTSFGMNGYPASFSALSPPFPGNSLGFSITLSNRASVSNLTFQLTLPQITVNQMSMYGSQKVALLYYDVDSKLYTRLPSSSASLSAGGLLTITGNQPGYFYLLNLNTNITTLSIDGAGAKFLIAAQSSQTLGAAFVTIANVLAPAGVITVRWGSTQYDNIHWMIPSIAISYAGSSSSDVASAALFYSTNVVFDDYDVDLATWDLLTPFGWIKIPTEVAPGPSYTSQVADVTGEWVMAFNDNGSAATSHHASLLLVIMLSIVAAFINSLL